MNQHESQPYFIGDDPHSHPLKYVSLTTIVVQSKDEEDYGGEPRRKFT